MEFVLNRGSGAIAFYLDFVLLPAKINIFIGKKNRKENRLIAHGTSYVKIIFALSTKIVAFYVQIFIVQVEIFGFKEMFARTSSLVLF